MKEHWKPLIYKDIDMSDRFLVSDNADSGYLLDIDRKVMKLSVLSTI